MAKLGRSITNHMRVSSVLCRPTKCRDKRYRDKPDDVAQGINAVIIILALEIVKK